MQLLICSSMIINYGWNYINIGVDTIVCNMIVETHQYELTIYWSKSSVSIIITKTSIKYKLFRWINMLMKDVIKYLTHKMEDFDLIFNWTSQKQYSANDRRRGVLKYESNRTTVF